MKIKKSAWHYKWLMKLSIRPKSNLCIYFWQVVNSVTVIPLLFILFGGGALVIALLLISGLVTFPLSVFLVIEYDTDSILGLSVFFGMLSYVASGIWLGEIIRRKFHTDTPSTDEDGLIKSYLASRKEKYCKRIYFE
jgi:hypothetical protein